MVRLMINSKATSPQWSASDVASCNHHIVNGMFCLGVESVMAACDETTLNLGGTSSPEYEIL